MFRTLSKNLLKFPLIYNIYQRMMGSTRLHKRLSLEFLKIGKNDKILDIGCGTANILSQINSDSITYYGFDGNDSYIRYAQKKWADFKNYHFYRQILDEMNLPPQAGKYNLVIAIGILHHLNDDEAKSLFRLAGKCLCPGGRLISWDPSRFQDESWLESLFARGDRGEFVREASAYEALARTEFKDLRLTIVKGFTHHPVRAAILECKKDVTSFEQQQGDC